MRSSKCLVVAALAVSLSSCAARGNARIAAPSPVAPLDTLRRDLTAIFSGNLPGGPVWSVRVESLDRPSEPLFALQPDQLMVPASNMKIVTLAVAADRFGWDHTFPTTFRATTPMTPDGTIRGDLVVRGTGDPMIGDRPSSTTSMTAIAEALWQQGVRRIGGRIIGDDGAFESDPLGAGWAWDDVTFSYSAPVGPLIYNDNSARVVVTPGASPGTAATVTLRDRDAGLSLINHVTTAPAAPRASIDMNRLPGSSEVKFAGVVPAGSQPVEDEIAVVNPTLYFTSTLRSALVVRGIFVGGTAADIDDAPPGPFPASSPVLLTWPSPSLADIGKRLMKVSQNLYAETLLRELAATPGHPGSAREGATIIGATAAQWGVPEGSLSVADGSGLSRYNLVSATALVRILAHMYSDAGLKDDWMAAMPVSAMDGTLQRRLKDTTAAGRVHAKTGSLSGVRTLSGYVQTTAGEWLVFSILANNFATPTSAADVDRVADQAMIRLATFAR